MASVVARQTICCEFTPEEFKLISDALFGRLEGDAVQLAKLFGEDLQTQKLKSVESAVKSARQLVEKIIGDKVKCDSSSPTYGGL